MNPSHPAVSVVMLAHNAGRFLAPAVRSVLNQDWRDLELVLRDDASTDGAVAALQAAERDPRLRVLPAAAASLGIATGTNQAVAQARGRYVAVMDHDDLAHPAKLARQVAWLDAHPVAAGVACRTRLIDADGCERGGDFTLHTPEEHRVFTAYAQAANFGSHLFRREVVAGLPRRVEFPFSSDFDFIARANERGGIAALPEVLFDYRVHAGQTTATRRREQQAAECVIRCLTALRRAGRPEPLAAAPGWLARLGAAAPGELYAVAVGLCLELDLPELATYHARRHVGAAGVGRGGPEGLALGARAMLRAGGRTLRCARLFFTGPLRTHGLRPWPPK